jgi:nucleoside-triphosphatase THEP1
MDRPKADAKVVLWVGPKHSGKSTGARGLADRAAAAGMAVAGLLAVAVRRGGCLMRFDVVDLATGRRRPLAHRAEPHEADVGRFRFDPGALAFGNDALASALARSAALVVVDEFGPLELRGEGWRPAVDRLLPTCHGVLLLVVREERTEDVARLYEQWRPRRVAAAAPDAQERVLRLVRARWSDTDSRA